jgi:hypothetical protein
VPLGHVEVQTPFTHVLPQGPQARPQVPQLLLSALRLVSQPSTARPLQSANPVAQAPTAQEPLRQAEVAFGTAGQTWPQAPQFLGSVCVLTQLPLHRVWPPLQLQTPLTHAAPFGHTLPHFPQLAALVWVSTHAPAQLVSPLAQQTPEHVPLIQL